MLAKVVLVNFVSLIYIANGARILGIVPSASISHQVVFQSLWRELSLRGHQVTTLTTDLINDPLLVNLTEIDLSFSYEHVNEQMPKVIEMTQANLITGIHGFIHLMVENLENQLQHSKVQDLINSKTAKFDLVMVEFLTPTMAAFAVKFNCPYIAMLSFDAPSTHYKIFGNPVHPVLNPDVVLPFSKNLSLLERIISVVYSYGISYYVTSLQTALEQSVLEKYFGNHYPSVRTMAANASLLFVNSDPILHQIRPLVPAVIQIGGGSHRTTAKPLPKELQKQLDNASSGFIYFSLGSNVKSNTLPLEIRNVLLSTFSELPYTILWKFESDNLPNKPDNVIVSKWLPQQDVLKHPNIKLFITQGGLQSMEEAIYDHVPMVGIPFFGDQPSNVKKMTDKGIGLSVDYNTLEKETFKQAILEVINNPKYRNTVKELAELASDQPMTGLERAVWWTEYVIRHKGAKHLRSPALDIPWYQYLLLDVIGVLLLAIAILIFILYVFVKSVIKLIKYVCCCKPKQKMKKQ